MIHILFNPLSNNKRGNDIVPLVEALFEGKDFVTKNVLEISNPKIFIDTLKSDDEIVVCGGDGTLYRFVNAVYDSKIKQKIYYFPSGNGNDFAHDVENDEKYLGKLIPLNKYIQSLPLVTINGVTRRFLNGVGMGIDGYCCMVGDELKAQNVKDINYAGIAIQGIFGKFKPGKVGKITVDGETKEYKNVWLAPTMFGKYYGGGMKVAPKQDRFNADKTLTVMIWTGKSKMMTLMRFSKIFVGEHVKYEKMIHFKVGHEVKVEFEKPIPIQVDGETFLNCTSYSVSYGK